MAFGGEVQAQVSYRVEQSIKLLNALGVREKFADPEVPKLSKVKSLNEINDSAFVNADINVQKNSNALN